MRVGILNAMGATVGDNIYSVVLRNHFRKLGIDVGFICDPSEHTPVELDFLVLGGGGIVYDRKDYSRLNWIKSWVNKAKHICGISLGYQGFDTETGESIWKDILSKAEVITVRDSMTAAKLESMGVTITEILPDLGWLCDAPTYRPAHFAYEVGVTANWDTDPITVVGAKYIPMGRDKKFPGFWGGKNVIGAEISISEFLDDISSCKILLSGRLHGFILGVRYGVPTFVLDDKYKIREQTRMVDYPYIFPKHVLENLPTQKEPLEYDMNKAIKVKNYARSLAFIHLILLSEWVGKK